MKRKNHVLPSDSEMEVWKVYVRCLRGSAATIQHQELKGLTGSSLPVGSGIGTLEPALFRAEINFDTALV